MAAIAEFLKLLVSLRVSTNGLALGKLIQAIIMTLEYTITMAMTRNNEEARRQ